ncbi:MAG TPA: T9SS type A sorting domain-containing protein [Bacteroidales bacterium]|nr:T9SS type A sorting domain-containing protein [Bacteroidales bacterium]
MKINQFFVILLILLTSAGSTAQSEYARKMTGSAQDNPVMVVEPSSFDICHPNPPQITSHLLKIVNEGDMPLDFNVTVHLTPADYSASISAKQVFTDNQFSEKFDYNYPPEITSRRALKTNENVRQTNDYELQFEYPCGDGTGEAGVETDGNFFYTSKWNGNSFFKYALDGTFLGGFTIDGVAGVRDLAFDGLYFYGSAASYMVFQMDFNTQTLVGTILAPVTARGIAYDEVNDGFWANNWSTALTLFDLQGNLLNIMQLQGDENFYGLACDFQAAYPLPCLWGYSQKAGTSQNLLYKYSLSTWQLIEIFDIFPLLTLVEPGDIAGGLAFQPYIVPNTFSLIGLVQNKCIWGLDVTLMSMYAADVGVSQIVQPASGVIFGIEPIIIRIKNFGNEPQSDIPWVVNWSGQSSGTANGILSGPLPAGDIIDVTAGTIDMSAYGSYLFEACTNLVGDEFSGNDCKTKLLFCDPPVCTYNLYTEGCSSGDGLTSWNLANIIVPDIPCSGTPAWYNNYTSMIHHLVSGQTYDLTVTAGNDNTWFDVWIDFDGNFDLTNDEIILNDAVCGTAGTFYSFQVIIPDDVPTGDTVYLRARTNSNSPVTDPCETYEYGNCTDFFSLIVPAPSWLSASPLTGSLNPGSAANIVITVNSTEMPVTGFEGMITIAGNDPAQPEVNVPVILTQCPSVYPKPVNLSLSITYAGYTYVDLSWELENNSMGKRFHSNQSAFDLPEIANSSSVLTGFDIFRNDTLVAPLMQGFYFCDTLGNPPFFPCCYGVAAHYTDSVCFSEEIVCISGVTVDEAEVSPEVTVYPNPAKEMINIRLKKPGGVIIYDACGNQVFSGKVSDHLLKVNTSGFQSGIYFVCIKTKEKTITRKVTVW